MTALVLRYKRGDAAPALRVQLLDNTTPVDLTAATSAKLLMRKPDGTLLDAPVTIENQTTSTGWVNRPWATAGTDLAQAGNYPFEIEVTWNDTRKQTFPADQNGIIAVHTDLG